MSDIATISERLPRCPVCGNRMWRKTPGQPYLGCKYGHVMDENAAQEAAELQKPVVVIQPSVHWPWYKHAEIPWAIAALLLVAQIVEVLTWI